MSYREIEIEVLRWAEARQIIPNSNAMAQAVKTVEEVGELLSAINKKDKAAIKDAYGDILVTMIIGAALVDVDLIDCLDGAYREIKDRKGTLGADGIFVKEAS